MLRTHLKTIIAMLLGILIGVSLSAQSVTESEKRQFANTLRSTAVNIELLHRLLIGEGASVQKTLARNIAFDVIALSDVATDSEIVPSDRHRLSQILALLAVMNEEFGIPFWRND